MPDDDRLPSLEAFDDKLKKANGLEKPPADTSGFGFGMRLSTELVAGVLVGVGLGLFLDDQFGTKPIWLIICLFLGAAGGVRCMMATLKQYERRESEKQERGEDRGR